MEICRSDKEKCLIEPSVNSVRVSICIKQSDEIEEVCAVFWKHRVILVSLFVYYASLGACQEYNNATRTMQAVFGAPSPVLHLRGASFCASATGPSHLESLIPLANYRDIVALRRKLHEFPELANCEHGTAATLRATLRPC